VAPTRALGGKGGGKGREKQFEREFKGHMGVERGRENRSCLVTARNKMN
jgi:hypothetical protein